MIRALAFTVATTLAPHAPQSPPLTIHLSPTLACVADAAAFNLTAGGTDVVIAGLVCPVDKVFANGFEP